MGFERVVDSFASNAVPGGFNLVEGNRGLYDGVDARGTHSTAELAKALQAPVVLVVNATKVTRTAAALVLGCQRLDPDVCIAGVVVNQVGGARHERIVREAIESVCGIPVLGVIPRAGGGMLLPTRHLGLVTPREHPHRDLLAQNLLDLVAGRLDFDRLMAIARQAPPRCHAPRSAPRTAAGDGLTIGYLDDSAFSFYYPENLEALRAAGARLVAISALTSASLPDGLDALYIGGGFPETHAQTLSGNSSFLASIRHAARAGLPIYAECGGLMLLSRALTWRGSKYPMAGVLPFRRRGVRRAPGSRIHRAPGGHGQSVLPDGNPAPGPRVSLLEISSWTASRLRRRAPCFAGRDVSQAAMR